MAEMSVFKNLGDKHYEQIALNNFSMGITF